MASADEAESFYMNVQEPNGPIASVFWYYAILAYPKYEDWQKRKNFVEALVVMRCKEFAVEIRSRKFIPLRLRRFKREKMLSRCNMGWKHIERRVAAGQIGWCLCLNGRRHPYDAPTEDGKLGVVLNGPTTVMESVRSYLASGQIAPDATHLEERSASANASHRIWAESLPVLHLAMAHPVVLKIIEGQVNSSVPQADAIAKSFFDSIHDPGWLRDALDGAEYLWQNLSPLVTANSNNPNGLGYRKEKAIRLIPTDDPALAHQFPKLAIF